MAPHSSSHYLFVSELTVKANSSEVEPKVFIVDDDHAVRDSIKTLLSSVGIKSQTHANADEFLSNYDPSEPGCLILDVRMPGMSGPDLQKKLSDMRVSIPTIVISGHGDIRTAVESLQAGAIDFLEKPLREQRLLELVAKGFEKDAQVRSTTIEYKSIKIRMALLSPREHEVLEIVTAGKSNKMIADVLKISHKTVESHRTNIMRKMDAQSVADLVRMALTVKAQYQQ